MFFRTKCYLLSVFIHVVENEESSINSNSICELSTTTYEERNKDDRDRNH